MPRVFCRFCFDLLQFLWFEWGNLLRRDLRKFKVERRILRRPFLADREFPKPPQPLDVLRGRYWRPGPGVPELLDNRRVNRTERAVVSEGL